VELSKGANECIVQAHMLRMRFGKNDKLCVEHLFYVLATISRYLDTLLDNLEFRAEAEAVRALLEGRVQNMESAVLQIEKDVKESAASLSDAASYIGRASEIAEAAGKDEIDAVCLLKAILETPTAPIKACLTVKDEKHAPEDAKYAARQEQTPKEPPKVSLTKSQAGALLAMLAARQDERRDALRESAKKPKQPKMKRRTKIGIFTYRGGVVSAAVQYFLLGIIVPFAALLALDVWTGAVTAPGSPLIRLLTGAFIVFWVFYLIRGINRLISLSSMALGHFLGIVSNCAMVSGFTAVAAIAYELADIPAWLRAVSCICALIMISIGGFMYRYLKDQGGAHKTKIMFQNVEGTAGMIFFRFLTNQLILPFAVFSIFWIFNIPVPAWLEKTFYILCFFWTWNIFFTMWNCIALRHKNSGRRRRGQLFVRFMGAQHVLLLLPGFALYLHWLFDWFPLATWVIVLYGIYGFVWLILSIGTFKHIKEDC